MALNYEVKKKVFGFENNLVKYFSVGRLLIHSSCVRFALR